MNWAQRFAVRLAARIAPPLGAVLRSAGGTVDRLYDQNLVLRDMLDDRREMWNREAQDLREAIAMANGGPWRAPLTLNATFTSSEAASDSTAVAIREGGAVVALKERLAELELALEDRGWKRQLALANIEFSRYGIQQIILISRLYFIKNPLINRGVLIIYGSQNEQVFRQAFQQIFVQGPNSAPSNGVLDAKMQVELWSTPRITTNAWYIFLTSAPRKAVFQQVRQSPRDNMEDMLNSDFARRTKIKAMQWDARYGFGLSLPYQAIQVS